MGTQGQESCYDAFHAWRSWHSTPGRLLLRGAETWIRESSCKKTAVRQLGAVVRTAGTGAGVERTAGAEEVDTLGAAGPGAAGGGGVALRGVGVLLGGGGAAASFGGGAFGGVALGGVDGASAANSEVRSEAQVRGRVRMHWKGRRRGGGEGWIRRGGV